MSVQILVGDCRDVLATLPAGSVQCCVTSPPYFGLRDYGTATWDGGDPACAHSVGGAGTTALVADRLQRSATIIELNPTYAALARNRINGEAGLFSSVVLE